MHNFMQEMPNMLTLVRINWKKPEKNKGILNSTGDQAPDKVIFGICISSSLMSGKTMLLLLLGAVLIIISSLQPAEKCLENERQPDVPFDKT